MLDATEASDRVDYCKLFRELLKRDLPAGYLRLPMCCGMVLLPFHVKNGVRQGGIYYQSHLILCIFGRSALAVTQL